MDYEYYMMALDYIHCKAKKALMREDLNEYEKWMKELKLANMRITGRRTHLKQLDKKEIDGVYFLNENEKPIYRGWRPKHDIKFEGTVNSPFYSRSFHEKLVNVGVDFYEFMHQINERYKVPIFIEIYKDYNKTVEYLDIAIKIEHEIWNYNERKQASLITTPLKHIKQQPTKQETNHSNKEFIIFFD